VKHPLAKKRRLTLDDLESEAFILMKEGHCLSGQALQFCRINGFAPRVSFRSAQIETILAFVLMCLAPGLFPAIAAVFTALCVLTVIQRSVIARRVFR
jgi:LysR family hydrogen peroxide-inducible transcriptional activator